jgi:hypothetical protein
MDTTLILSASLHGTFDTIIDSGSKTHAMAAMPGHPEPSAQRRRQAARSADPNVIVPIF